MAVLIEGHSVVVRRGAIEERFRGGWHGFLLAVPNATACYDEHLARVGFMDPADVRAYVAEIEAGGLVHNSNGVAVDLVVVDQIRGPATPTPWLHIATVTLAGGKVITAHLNGQSSGPLAVPRNWTYESSLSRNFGFTAAINFGDNLKFQRREVDQDIYLDLKSGREVFVGRAATDGRSHAALFTRLEKLAHRVLEIDGQSKPLKAMGDPDAARPLFEELDERLLPEIRRIAEGDGQDYAFAQFSYGLVLRALARQSAAERHFRRANELQPRTLNILNELVRCLGEQGRNSEALPFAREAVAVAPNDPASWGNLAMCLIQVGNKDDAKKAIDHAILLDPSDPTNRYIRDNFPRYFI